MPHTTTHVGIMCLISTIIIIPSSYSSAGGVTPVSVSIIPQQVHFLGYTTTYQNITCKATLPLSRCEFRIFDLTINNLTQVLHGIYEDNGLASGECATTLESNDLTVDHYYIATCRVRSATSDWSYASMSVYKTNKAKIYLEKTAYDQVVLPGTKQNLAVRGSTSLNKCSMKSLPSKSWEYPFQTPFVGFCRQTPAFYGGDDVKCERTCGMTFENVTEAENGIILFDLESWNYRDITFISLIVAKLPHMLTLSHEIVENDQGSMTLRATCIVFGGRPAPLLAWTLDGNFVPNDAVRSATSNTWVWPFQEQTLRQFLVVELNASHAGKSVECAATHVAYKLSIYNSFTIRNDSTVTTSLTTSSTSNMTYDRHVTSLYVVIGVLVSLLVLLAIVAVIYGRHKALCCFAGPTEREGVSIKYRRSLDATLRYEETRSPTVSSIDRSSAVTGLEYAEIRVSMVQRCVDRLEADTAAGTLSPETGEISEEASRPNSLYLGYDEKL